MSTPPVSSSGPSASGIESTLHETRTFDPPSAESVGGAPWIVGSMDKYRAMHQRSVEDPDAFFAEEASRLHWFKRWDRACEFTPPDAKWFVGGTTNLCYNCVDRHVDDGHGEDVGLVWEGEPIGPTGQPEVKAMTYRELQREVAKFAHVLRRLGVERGDVVTIYMGMIPELAIATLACARLGAVHSVIFGGFSSQAIADRVADAKSKVIITCDGAWRRGKVVPLKENVDAAINELSASGGGGAGSMLRDSIVENVVYVERTNTQVVRHPGRDHAWADLMAVADDDDTPCEELDSEAPAFLLYTSGSTGKPKGIAHTVGGYMVHTAMTARYTFNLVPGLDTPKRSAPLPSGQLYWCTADVGWITGHSSIVYGPLANGATMVMYEGAPNAPHEGRFWELCERHGV
ncbi:MAG: AMP-binding protein, partial [Planctomycetota bacterium]